MQKIAERIAQEPVQILTVKPWAEDSAFRPDLPPNDED